MIRITGSGHGLHMSGSSAARITVGAGFVASGVLFALNGLGITHLSWGEALGRFWPGLFLLWGLLEVVGGIGRRDGRRRLRWWPLLVAAGAALLLADNLHLLSATANLVWALVWAALAVFVGVELLFGQWFSIGDVRYGPPRPRFPNVIDLDGETEAEEGDDHGFGHQRVRADEAWELSDRVYRHGLGDFQLDLSHARLREGETRIAIQGGIGEIQVLVPEGVAVDIEGQVRMGEVRIFGRETSGIDRSLSYRSEGYADAERRLRLDLVMRIGDITVERVL